MVDHALHNEGQPPSYETVKSYRHKLQPLLSKANAIAEARCFAFGLPNTSIHRAVIGILSDFAEKVRYYNLDLITKGHIETENPIAVWWQHVTQPVLDKHQPHRAVRREARELGELADRVGTLRYQTEEGSSVISIADMLSRDADRRAAIPWERMYVLQIARFLAKLLGELGHIAQVEHTIYAPDFSEIFQLFDQDDDRLRRLKTWSIYI